MTLGTLPAGGQPSSAAGWLPGPPWTSNLLCQQTLTKEDAELPPFSLLRSLIFSFLFFFSFLFSFLLFFFFFSFSFFSPFHSPFLYPFLPPFPSFPPFPVFYLFVSSQNMTRRSSTFCDQVGLRGQKVQVDRQNSCCSLVSRVRTLGSDKATRCRLPGHFHWPSNQASWKTANQRKSCQSPSSDWPVYTATNNSRHCGTSHGLFGWSVASQSIRSEDQSSTQAVQQVRKLKNALKFWVSQCSRHHLEFLEQLFRHEARDWCKNGQ